MLLKRIFLLSLLIFSKTVFGQKQFSEFQYTSKNGLPQNSVKSMIMDDNGFLWMTTEGGLVRFDGLNFKVFNRTNTPFIRTDRLKAIIKSSDNRLFAYDDLGGVYQINSNGISFIADLHQHWIWKSYYLKKLPLAGHKYAVISTKGLNIYNDTLQVDSINTSAYDVFNYFMSNGNIYFITRTQKIFLIDINNRIIIPCIFNNSFSLTLEKLIWEYGRPGIFIKDGSNLFTIKPNISNNSFTVEWLCDKLPANCLVSCIYNDVKNNLLFVGTDAKGLFVFKETYFKTLLFKQPEPGKNNAYYSQVALDSNTALSYNKRMISYDKITASSLPFAFNLAGVIRDRYNNIWYNENNQLFKYNLLSHKKKIIAASEKEYACSFNEQGDTMWTGSAYYISYVYKDTMHKVYKFSEQVSLGYPNCMLTTPDQKLCFSTGNGLYKLDKQTYSVDTIPELKNQCVRTITFHNGFLFIGTYGNGYYLEKNKKVSAMPMDKNNFLSQVHTFVFDSNGFVWMTTNQGLFKTKEASLEKHFNDPKTQVAYLQYNEEDGINNAEFNGGCFPSSLTLKNGFVSLPTMDGMVWYKPNEVKDIIAASPIIIDAVYFDNKRADTSLLNKIPATVQNIRIDFASSYWGNKNNLNLEYKLAAFSKQWMELDGQQCKILFSNLHSGDYQLTIRKRAGWDANDFVIKTIAIKVEKKFFETFWFLLLSVLGATLLIIAIAKMYANRIKKRNKLLEANVKLRTFELAKANEQLQQSVTVKDKLISIISHDIVTPLRFISIVARQGSNDNQNIENESMRSALLDIKNTSEKLRDNAQNILNWIKNQNNRINVIKTHVAAAALVDEVGEMIKEMADAKQTVIVNNVSAEDIIKTDRNILSILLHNVLTNAVKFTSNGSITVDAKHNNEYYLITITDTGTGMSAGQLNNIQQRMESKAVVIANPSSGANGNGLGYIIMSELMELLNGKIAIESTPGKGTVVTFYIPVNNGSSKIN